MKVRVRSLLALLLILYMNLVWASEPSWVRVSSAHFSVLTNAGEKRGREVALRFEQIRIVFADLFMKTRVNLPEPLDVIAVKSEGDYLRLVPPQDNKSAPLPGFFLPGEDRNYIVLDVSAEDSWRAVLHPFAHLLLNFNYPPTQPWFDEGFAEYFSSLRLDDKQAQLGADPELALSWKRNLIGDVQPVRGPRSLTEILSGPAWLPIQDLFAAQHEISNYGEGPRQTLFDAESWMVLHYLLHKDKLSETGTYFGLVKVQKLPIEKAVQQAYGVSAQQFQQNIKDYFHSLAPLFQAPEDAKRPDGTDPGGAITRIDVPVANVGASVQPVAEPLADALVNEMVLRIPQRREQAMQHLQTAAADEKNENAVMHRALAWALMTKKEFQPAQEQISRAAELDNRDFWVRYYAALIKFKQAEGKGSFQGLSNMIQDLRIVLDASPDFAQAYDMLALARLEGGGINSALQSIGYAIQLAPRSDLYLLHKAQTLMAAKKWDETSALLEKLKTSSDGDVAHQARQTLEDLPTIKKYGVLPERSQSPASPQLPVAATDHSESASDDETTTAAMPAAPAPDKRKVEFLKGRLLTVECSKPAAVLTVVSGTRKLRLRTEDYSSLTLIGTDQFSCAWRNLPVTVNYKAGGKSDGDLVSLELRQ
jgi:tetratricopeptide (TPR) repeat protein